MVIDDEVWGTIENDPTVGSIYSSYIEQTDINNILGKSSGFVVFLSETDMEAVFDECGFEITEGRLPSDAQYEIIMHDDMLKNKELSVGDKFGNAVDSSEPVVGEYTIVGAFKGNSVIALGSKNYNVEQLKDIGLETENALFAGLVFPEHNLELLNSMLDEMEGEGVSVYTSSGIKKSFDEQSAGISSLMLIIIIVVVIGISAAVGVALSTVYNSRMDEFGILYAIGYSKGRILFVRIFGEISKLVIGSWILGVLLSFGSIQLIDMMIFENMGQSLDVFSSQSFVYTLVSLAVILLTTSVPIITKLSKADLITIIERR